MQLDLNSKTAVCAAIKSIGTGEKTAPEIVPHVLQENWWSTASQNLVHNMRSVMLTHPQYFTKVRKGVFKLTPLALSLYNGEAATEVPEPKPIPKLVVDNTPKTAPPAEFNMKRTLDTAIETVANAHPQAAKIIEIDGEAVIVCDGFDEIPLGKSLAGATADDLDEMNEELAGYIESDQARDRSVRLIEGELAA